MLESATGKLGSKLRRNSGRNFGFGRNFGNFGPGVTEILFVRFSFFRCSLKCVIFKGLFYTTPHCEPCLGLSERAYQSFLGFGTLGVDVINKVELQLKQKLRSFCRNLEFCRIPKEIVVNFRRLTGRNFSGILNLDYMPQLMKWIFLPMAQQKPRILEIFRGNHEKG